MRIKGSSFSELSDPSLLSNQLGPSHLQAMRAISLRLLLVIPLIVQIMVSVGLTGYLSWLNGQKAVNELASKLQTEISNHISQQLESYMSTPANVSENNWNAIATDVLDIADSEKLSHYFWQQVKTFQVGYVILGFKSGKFLGVGHYFGDHRITLDEVNPNRHGNYNAYVYEMDSQGQRGQRLINNGNTFRNGQFSLQQEGWYREAVTQKKPIWTSVYNWAVPPFPLSIASSCPLFDRNNQLVGVIAVEKQLTQISEFLNQLQVSPRSRTFILERSGYLIASSIPEKPFRIIDNKPKRLSIIDSQDPLMRETATYLQKRFGQFSEIREQHQLNFGWNNQRYFLQVKPWQHKLGLNWLVVVVVPESDFMGQIQVNNQMTLWVCLMALSVALLSGYWISQWIIRSLDQLSIATQRMATGQLNQIVQEGSIKELNGLGQSFNRMAQQLQESFTTLAQTNEQLEQRVTERTVELESANQELQNLVHQDGLTQVANRRYFDQYLEQEWQRKIRENQPLSLILCDIDFFKGYNDYYGHPMGDRCLQQVAQAIQRTIKRPADLVARYGGEEFAIVLPNTTLEGAIQVAERIQHSVAELAIAHQASAVSTVVTVSMGISHHFHDTGGTAEALIRAADQGLYAAKARGRNTYAMGENESC